MAFYDNLVEFLKTHDFNGYADESFSLEKDDKEYRVDLKIEEVHRDDEAPRFRSARTMLDYIAHNGEGWFCADNPEQLILGYRDKHGDVSSISLKDLKWSAALLTEEEQKCLQSAQGRHKLIELVRSKSGKR